MGITRLDHVNIRTANLDDLVEWYSRVLGLETGPRPPFSFPGAWIYAGEDAVIHLVGVESEPSGIEPKLEHFALSATGLDKFLAHLDDCGTEYSARRVPGFNILQINLNDLDGNHIHVDFPLSEKPA